MQKVKLFTDGSSLNNQKSKKGGSFGGIGGYIVYADGEEQQYSEVLEGSKITNQVAELTAYLRGLEILIEKNIKNFVYVYTDSMYLINIYTNWIKKWESAGWTKADGKEIENLDLIKEIYNKIKETSLKIFYKHVRSHQDKPDEGTDEYLIWYGNNKADELATYSANIAKEQAKEEEEEKKELKNKRKQKNTTI